MSDSVLPLAPSKSAPRLCEALTLEALASTAGLLARASGRHRAARFVDDMLENLEDRRALLLLARLHLDGNALKDAEAALMALSLWRLLEPWDLEAVALYRVALLRLGREDELTSLDREARWMILGAMGAVGSDPQGGKP